MKPEDVGRLSRLVARLPRMITEEDDYAWVPLGDVLVAIGDIDASEAAWPADGERIVMKALLRIPDYEAAADALEHFVESWGGNYDDASRNKDTEDSYRLARSALRRLRDEVTP